MGNVFCIADSNGTESVLFSGSIFELVKQEKIIAEQVNELNDYKLSQPDESRIIMSGYKLLTIIGVLRQAIDKFPAYADMFKQSRSIDEMDLTVSVSGLVGLLVRK